MIIQTKEVTMSCTLILSERETKMLAYLSGYGGENIANAISKDLTTEFPKEEWIKLWSDFRTVLEATAEVFNNTRYVFKGIKKAVDNKL
jgi:hypothetical protein